MYWPNLVSSVGSIRPASPAMPWSITRAYVSASVSGWRAASRRVASTPGSVAAGGSVTTASTDGRRGSGTSKAISPRAGQVEHRRRQRPPGRSPVVDEGGRGRREVGRRGGHEDRWVVGVDRVATAPPPGQGGRRDRQQEEGRADDQSDERVDDPAAGQGWRRSRAWPLASTRARPAPRAPFMSHASRRGSMSFWKIALALLVRQVGDAIARTGVQLDLAVALARVEIEQDHQAVIEARPADAPLVHQGPGIRLGLVARHAVVDDLAVDDDLGAGSSLDALDRGLGRRDRGRVEDAGRVVDPLVRHRIGVGRPGGEGDRGNERSEEGSRENRQADGPQRWARHDVGREATHQTMVGAGPRRRTSVSAPSPSSRTSAGRRRPL